MKPKPFVIFLLLSSVLCPLSAATAIEPVCLDRLAIYDHIAEARPDIRLAFVGFNHRDLAVEIWRDDAGWLRIERGANGACIVDIGDRHTDGGDLPPCLMRASVAGIGAADASVADVCP